MLTNPSSPRLSVVVPVRDEAGNVGPVIEEVMAALGGRIAFEVIAVDDGSTDGTPRELARLAARHAPLRVLRHPVGAGKSAAVHNGVLAARAAVVATIDGDGQNPAAEILRVAAPILEDATGRVGLVAGQRRARRDTLPKRLASRAANALRRRLLGDGTRDTACGLKAARREALLAMPYFDNMHRFLPALARAGGWEVALVDVDDRPRLSGASKYTNWGRAVTGASDLAGVLWLLRRRKRALALPAVMPAPAAPASAAPTSAPAPLDVPGAAAEPAR